MAGPHVLAISASLTVISWGWVVAEAMVTASPALPSALVPACVATTSSLRWPSSLSSSTIRLGLAQAAMQRTSNRTSLFTDFHQEAGSSNADRCDRRRDVDGVRPQPGDATRGKHEGALDE